MSDTEPSVQVDADQVLRPLPKKNGDPEKKRLVIKSDGFQRNKEKKNTPEKKTQKLILTVPRVKEKARARKVTDNTPNYQKKPGLRNKPARSRDDRKKVEEEHDDDDDDDVSLPSGIMDSAGTGRPMFEDEDEESFETYPYMVGEDEDLEESDFDEYDAYEDEPPPSRLKARREQPDPEPRTPKPTLNIVQRRTTPEQRRTYLDDEETIHEENEGIDDEEESEPYDEPEDERPSEYQVISKAQDIVNEKETILQAAMRKHKVAMENLRKDTELFESLESLFSLTAKEAEMKGFGTKDLDMIDSFDEEDVQIIREHRERVQRMSALLEKDFTSRLEAFEKTVGAMRRILEHRSRTLNRLEDKEQLISRYPSLSKYFFQKQEKLKQLLKQTEDQLTDGLVQSLAEVEALRGDVETLIQAKVRT